MGDNPRPSSPSVGAGDDSGLDEKHQTHTGIPTDHATSLRKRNDLTKPSEVAKPQPHNLETDVQHEANYPSSRPHDGTSTSTSTSTVAATNKRHPASGRSRATFEGPDYEIPDQWENLNEVAPVSPVDETPRHRPDLESLRQPHEHWQGDEDQDTSKTTETSKQQQASKLGTKLYTWSYLIFFSLFGTLARVGLTALTTYPGTPVIFSTVWANFGGSFIMGFLAEDRKIFRHEWGQSTQQVEKGQTSDEATRAAAKKAHLAVKKTIPLYIGMATGFCGSMTSFSTFIRDAFLALSNDMSVPGAADLPSSRNGGYSFMAMLAVIISTVALSLSGLIVGAHFALAVEPYLASLRFRTTRKIIDPAFVVLGWGCWLGAVLLAIWPPEDYWRKRIVFSLVFAPLGTLLRFYLAVLLNAKKPAFPLGTFAANIFGTVVLGMAWDITHASVGGVIGCQILQGIQDGFCGCLTTISTWVAELSTLRRKHAYVYGSISVVVALALMIAVMGGLRWSHGFDALLCS